MAVLRVGFAGFRTGDLAGMRRILEAGLGLEPTRSSSGQASYRLADGTLVEAYDKAEAFHRFFTTGPVVGFVVDDFDEALPRLSSLGVECLTGIQVDGDTRWVHVRLVDGTVAELMGVPPGDGG